MKKMKVALLQVSVKEGDIERNLEMIRLVMNSVVADAYFTPEMALSGFQVDDLETFKIDGIWGIIKEISEGTVLGMGGPLYEGGKLYNSYLIFEDGKLIHARRKKLLFDLMNERELFSEGEFPEPFQLHGMKFAVVICYELRFPELFWKLARQGVHAFLVPAAWPASRVEAWRALIRARAIENLAYVLAVNRWGKGKYGPFGGYSALIDPSGEGYELGEGVGALVGELDPEVVLKAREFPSWKDRLRYFDLD
ncbi:nitrilase [Ignicoccus pacificus DSM 13166]|uniref:Nitrilase n=1 Tax=Ignicoccus pacificus DSM 13166 TaxID=940294 RepID=A0A977K9T8_9CREN|nr:nitrilase [Ignicoccus pacificus DSM 13166]